MYLRRRYLGFTGPPCSDIPRGDALDRFLRAPGVGCTVPSSGRPSGADWGWAPGDRPIYCRRPPCLLTGCVLTALSPWMCHFKRGEQPKTRSLQIRVTSGECWGARGIRSKLLLADKALSKLRANSRRNAGRVCPHLVGEEGGRRGAHWRYSAEEWPTATGLNN